MKSSDRQLIRNIRKGDAKSFEELFDRYYDRFYAFACALLHDRDAAEDILQNVFLKLDEDRSVSNYLLVSVRNEIYDWLSLKYNSAVVRCSAPPESEDYSADIEESMAVLETSGRLDRIISSMPPQRQKVFMMSRYRGMSSKEISEALDISVRTVERHIHLALKDLRNLLS